MIKPTPGRVVWYYPAATENIVGAGNEEPLAAVIAKVWSDTYINVMVIDANGVGCSRTSITLHQDGNEVPAGSHCAWMPYQKGEVVKGPT